MSPLLRLSTLLGLAASIVQVSAHGYVQGIDIGGTYYSGYIVERFPYMQDPPKVIGWADKATDLGFIAPSAYSTPDIICHKDAKNAEISAPVKAGSTVRIDWKTWPSSHKGPVIDYLAACNNGDCTTVDKSTLAFFKIDEAGIVDSKTLPGTWATDKLIAANNSWTVKIPASIAPGSYVLRHEIIALHSAGSANGAQNYPQCINIKVTGGGTEAPKGTLGTGLYKAGDPGILFNLYSSNGQGGLEYTIPGPPLYSVGSGSGSGSESGSGNKSGSKNGGGNENEVPAKPNPYPVPTIPTPGNNDSGDCEL